MKTYVLPPLLLALTVLASCKPAPDADGKPDEPTATAAGGFIDTGVPKQLPTLEVRGLQIGYTAEEVAEAASQRGMFISPLKDGRMMEMHFDLPRHEDDDTLYVDTPECRQGIEEYQNLTAEERQGPAALRVQDCQLAGRAFYGPDGAVVAFYVTPAGFGLDGVTLKELTQAFVDNHDTGELVSEARPINSLGQTGFCTEYLGLGVGDEKVKVSDCGFKRVQIEQPPATGADFS